MDRDPPARPGPGRPAPTRFDELANDDLGLVADDLHGLKAALESAIACRQAAAPHGAPRRIGARHGSPRRACRAARAAGNDAAVVLRHQHGGGRARRPWRAVCGQTESALDALTQLIEAAPFPMWYRGPDLRLGLVNSAFVAAVEARDAAEVIARGTELVDSPGGGKRARRGRSVRVNSASPIRAPSRRRSARSAACCAWSTSRSPTGAVAGFAIDIQDLEDARIELARHVESQRELADRMTAGAAQFDADRHLDFFNQPFAIMARIDPEWLAEKPEFDRVLERMREMNRLPEVRDFPAWKAERRDWFTSARRADRGGLDPRQRRPSADRRPAAARRRPAPDLRGSDRAGPAGLGARHLAARARRDVRQSVRGDQRVRLRRAALPVEPPLLRGVGPRRGLGSASIRASTSWSRRWRGGSPIRPPRRRSASWSASATSGRQPSVGPRVADRRPPFRVRRGAAARRQCAVHDDRRHRLHADRGGAARSRDGRWRRPTGSRPPSSPT